MITSQPAATGAPTGRGAGRRVPVARGGLPFLGHLLELRRDPLRLMRRVHAECGEIGEVSLAGQEADHGVYQIGEV